jgi:ferrous iron transport protein A
MRSHNFKIRKRGREYNGSFATSWKIVEIKLSEMEPGQEGIIQKFNNDDLLLKLMEMGCLPGERIILDQVAPLGDPISVTISGYSLSLRLNEAENIMVEVTT